MSYLGFDFGTYNLVVAEPQGEGWEYRHQMNAFIQMPLADRAVFNMMKMAKVPLVEKHGDNTAYALGKSAVSMAHTMTGVQLRRPMKDGCVNPGEVDAQQILNLLAHNLIGEIKEDNTVVYYSVPANAINTDTDADYHEKVLEGILKAYRSKEGYKLDPRPINEALALVYSELGDKAFTGAAVSCGAGMVNVCVAVFGAPVLTFAIVNSGDWIDKQASKAIGEETTNYVNREKMKTDLTVDSPELVQRAIKAQYEIMIQRTVSEIKKGLEGTGGKIRTDEPLDFVVAGGTSMPKGFPELFEKSLSEAGLGVQVGRVFRPSEPLYAVAKGCCIAAQNSQ